MTAYVLQLELVRHTSLSHGVKVTLSGSHLSRSTWRRHGSSFSWKWGSTQRSSRWFDTVSSQWLDQGSQRKVLALILYYVVPLDYYKPLNSRLWEGYIHEQQAEQTCAAVEEQWLLGDWKKEHIFIDKNRSMSYLWLPGQFPQQVAVPHKPLISLKITSSRVRSQPELHLRGLWNQVYLKQHSSTILFNKCILTKTHFHKYSPTTHQLSFLPFHFISAEMFLHLTGLITNK